jgi:hypothetical protein
VTRSEANDQTPAWSPDGQRIAFSSDRNFPFGESPEIYSMRPDGSCLTWLTNGSPASDAPAWEPGVDRSSDPGVCGATARAPLVSTDLRRARRFKSAPAYWLGRIAFNGLLLSDVDGGPEGASINYGDCGRFDPADCPLVLAVDNVDVCAPKPPPLRGFHPRRLRRVGGSLVYTDPIEDGFTEVYAGRTTIALGEQTLPRVAAILPELRPLGSDEPAVLPQSAFPRSRWRALDRVETVRRRLGSVRAVARELELSAADVRDRLAVRRELVDYGAGRLDC